MYVCNFCHSPAYWGRRLLIQRPTDRRRICFCCFHLLSKRFRTAAGNQSALSIALPPGVRPSAETARRWLKPLLQKLTRARPEASVVTLGFQ